MSGKPQYDESAVLNAAIGVFWGMVMQTRPSAISLKQQACPGPAFISDLGIRTGYSMSASSCIRTAS
ncbi:hypothetical protein HL670_01690 [Serratia plymuthica]|nr:hypothetical protein HL670_01690 [Serratia plymuthica]